MRLLIHTPRACYLICFYLSLFTLCSSTKCTMNDSTDTLDCSHQGLDTTAILLHPHERERIKIADFSNNNIHQVDVFHQFPNVQELYLPFNSIEDLSSDTFTSLKLLERLNLSYNNIIHLDPLIFTSNKHMKSVSFRRNSLTLDPHEPIICSTSLLYFDLALCGISVISKENLVCLPSLTYLDLSFNNLVSLHPSTFIYVNKLGSIFLNSNRFHCDCLLFELLQWTESKRSDLSSQSLYCSLPDNKGIKRVEEIAKHLNCSVQPDFSLKSQIKDRFPNTSKNNNTSIQCLEGNIVYYNQVNTSLYNMIIMLLITIVLLFLIMGYLIFLLCARRRHNFPA